LIALPDDFRDVLIALADAGAAFAVVGGHAVAFYGHPRATKDLDVLVQADAQNAERVYRALIAFGAPVQAFDITVADFAGYNGVLQIGVPPLRIDLLTSISGISTTNALENCETFELEGRIIRVIGLNALLANKRAAGRVQDLADVAILERLQHNKG